MEQPQEGDRGFMSFAQNLINKPKECPPTNALIDADIKAITNAMSGAGTKEKDLINVLCQRSKEHLVQMKAVYNWHNKLDLLSKIQLETSGRFQRVFETMILDNNEVRANYVKKAVDGIGTNETMLIDTILTCSNKQIKAVQEQYKKMFLIPMALRVNWDTSGLLQENLDAIMNCSRPESGVQKELVQQDLDVLLKATEQKVGTNEKALVHMIASRSKDHLALLNVEFQKVSKAKKPFIETIKAETSGVVERAFVANFSTPAQWHAFRIYSAMKGLGTDEESLLRCILLPTQAELKVAIRLIKTIYKQDLVKEIKGDLWGNVKDALVTYVVWVDANVADVGDSATAAFNATPAPAATAATVSKATDALVLNPHANRIWKSLQEEVEVLRADNLSLRQELAKLKGGVGGSRELNFEAQEQSREFKF